MNGKGKGSRTALTMVELIVVIAVICLLASMVVPAGRKSSFNYKVACVNNLKQIGTAYRLWCGDGDRYPAQHPGGWQLELQKTNQGAWCWTNYVLMANELGQSPRVLICPNDKREHTYASGVAAGPGIDKMVSDNSFVSYFVGVGAMDPSFRTW